MIISITECWKAAAVEHHKYFDAVVLPRRQRLQGSLPDPVIRFLEKHHDKIREGDESDFRAIQKKYLRLMSSFMPTRQDEIKKVIKQIFSYSAFSAKSSNGGWCAYSLCAKLGSTTCPYCNLAYGHTLVIKRKGRIRPELDHFFDKANYPLFSISLNNFVPSCHFCNSSLKHSGDFFTTPHLNPLLDDEVIKIVLDVNPVKARNDEKLFDTANIQLEYDKANPKAVNSVATFHLEERYQFLVNEAREVAKYVTVYRGRQALIKGDIEWAKRGVNALNYKNRVLGKLILDIAGLYL